MSTKVCTGVVRFSYLHVFEPYKEKYGVTLLIPKSDTKTLEKIRAAQNEAAQNFRAKNGQSSLPAKPTTTLWDGDGYTKNGDEFAPECKGHWVISVSSKDPILLLDQNKKPITDRSLLYSGCYGQAVINFFGYSAEGNKGISAGLQGLRKIKDGEPLGGSTCRDSDFDDEDIDAALGDDDDFMV